LILTQLANALGIGAKYNPLFTPTPGTLVAPDPAWDAFEQSQCQTAYAAYTNNMKNSGYTVPSWSDFVKSPILTYQTFLGTPYYYPLAANVAKGSYVLPMNPGGKIQLYSDWLATTDPMTPLPPASGRLTVLGYPLPPTPQYVSAKRGFYDPLVTKYPLTLITPHSAYRQHSYMWHNPMMNGNVYRHSIHLNVSDAVARGIKDGDMVRVFNETGETHVVAYVTSRIVPGVACLRMGSWYTTISPGVHSNGDANGLLEPLDGSPHYPAAIGTVVEVQAL
jgi:anaerobic dimethyl sulfoxide reductase subunit A